MRRGQYLFAARRSRINLTARGRPLRTFGTLVAFSVSLLLWCGGYLIAEQIAHPVEAQAGALLFAALLIATAATLIYPLIAAMTKIGSRAASEQALNAWRTRVMTRRASYRSSIVTWITRVSVL